MRRTVLLLAVVILVTSSSCKDSSDTSDAVEVPADAVVVASLKDPGATDGRGWEVVRQTDGCVRLHVRVGTRGYVSDERCPFLETALDIGVAEIRYNDEPRHVEPCDDACAGPETDTTMSSNVLWGRVAPEVGFVCMRSEDGLVVVRPQDGAVLATLDADRVDVGTGDGLLFMADGRFIGPSRPFPGAELIERCRTEGAPGLTPPTPVEWPFTIELDRSLQKDQRGLFIATDTGYHPEGWTFAVLANDPASDDPLPLYADTTSLRIYEDAEDGSVGAARDEQIALPALVRDVLAGRVICTVKPTIVLTLSKDSRAIALRDGECDD